MANDESIEFHQNLLECAALLKCFLCEKIMENPTVIITCQHRFCDSCIRERFTETNITQQCFICQCSFTESEIRSCIHLQHFIWAFRKLLKMLNEHCELPENNEKISKLFDFVFKHQNQELFDLEMIGRLFGQDSFLFRKMINQQQKQEDNNPLKSPEITKEQESESSDILLDIYDQNTIESLLTSKPAPQTEPEQPKSTVKNFEAAVVCENNPEDQKDNQISTYQTSVVSLKSTIKSGNRIDQILGNKTSKTSKQNVTKKIKLANQSSGSLETNAKSSSTTTSFSNSPLDADDPLQQLDREWNTEFDLERICEPINNGSTTPELFYSDNIDDINNFY